MEERKKGAINTERTTLRGDLTTVRDFTRVSTGHPFIT